MVLLCFTYGFPALQPQLSCASATVLLDSYNGPSGELSWWGIILVGSCPGGELSLWGVVLVGNRPSGELS